MKMSEGVVVAARAQEGGGDREGGGLIVRFQLLDHRWEV